MSLSLEELLKKIPEPQKSYNWQNVKFDLYVAKNLGRDNWLDENLKQIVLKCRQAFERYGSIGLLDERDDKSLISLIRVRYDEGEKTMEEWFSVRFIRALGEPFLTEDLMVKFKDGRNLFEVISHKYYQNESEAAEGTATISRFCGFGPYDTEGYAELVGGKKRFTTLAFHLMVKTVLEDFWLPDHGSHFTAMFHGDILNKLRVFKWNKSEYLFEFESIHKILEMPEDFFLDFSPGPVALRYPTYFFNLKKFVAWIKNSMLEKRISVATVRDILGRDVDVDRAESLLNKNPLASLEILKDFGIIFDKNEKLPDSVHTGHYLGARLDAEVEKTLVLNIFEKKDLVNRIKRFLSRLNFE